MTARILVVEDDNIVVMELRDRLESLGCLVVGVASSGNAAIETAAVTQPDLVLMDIRLKGSMDGVEAAAEIRARWNIPVVYLTAYADEDTLHRAKITEPFGYIIKPFEQRELHAAIETALYKHSMEKRLREREQWLDITLRSISDGVIATNDGGLVSFINPVAEALTGWDQRDALGKRSGEVFRIIYEENRWPAEDPVLHTLWDGRHVHLAGRILLSKDGKEVPIEGDSAPIRDHEGRITGAVLFFRDVSERLRQQTEREELQAQLFQAQKMEAMGVLAGGIAHDLSNQMTPIIGNSSLILSMLPADDPLRERVEAIQRSGERAAALIQQILAFSRKQMPAPQVLDLNAVLLGVEDMIERLIGEDTTLIKSLEADSSLVNADPAQIEQVVMNLVINAVEAMPKGGTLTIEIEQIALNEEKCRSAAKACPGPFVRLSISDTGVGIEPEVVQHIFEPFFSTKKAGSGLGLAIAYNVVEQSQGWIEVDSEPGKGSAFHVYLPVVADSEIETAAVLALGEYQGHGERILVVEDDQGVRATVSEMLQASGYFVENVDSGRAALEVFAQEKGRFHLLFSDVVLPDMDGLELVDELLSQKPELPVLLSSGYTDKRSQWPIIQQRGFHFVQKPYGLSALLPAVRQALRRT